MLEFKTIETLKQNTEILEATKDYTYKVKQGTIKHLLHTNLQVIKPTEYLLTYPTTLTILEYKVNEIKEHNQKYSLSEIIQILKKIKV